MNIPEPEFTNEELSIESVGFSFERCADYFRNLAEREQTNSEELKQRLFVNNSESFESSASATNVPAKELLDQIAESKERFSRFDTTRRIFIILQEHLAEVRKQIEDDRTSITAYFARYGLLDAYNRYFVHIVYNEYDGLRRPQLTVLRRYAVAFHLSETDYYVVLALKGNSPTEEDADTDNIIGTCLRMNEYRPEVIDELLHRDNLPYIFS